MLTPPSGVGAPSLPHSTALRASSIIRALSENVWGSYFFFSCRSVIFTMASK